MHLQQEDVVATATSTNFSSCADSILLMLLQLQPLLSMHKGMWLPCNLKEELKRSSETKQ
jgi:hypothetical protein